MCLAIRFIALAVIALHLVAGRLPEEAAWSVWPYSRLPVAIQWLGALAAASLVLNPVSSALERGLDRLKSFLRDKVPAVAALRDRRLWFALAAASAAVPFWILRIRHLRWGDAYFIVRSLAYTGPDRPIWTIYNWQAPLTIFTHARLWFLLNPAPGVGVDTLYALTSVLSGVGFVYVLFLLSNALGRDGWEKGTIVGLVITSGAMQLFFGYVENYTIMSLGLLSSLYLGVRCLQGKVSLAWPSLALAITNAFHPSTIVLWPAMGYIAWRRVDENRRTKGIEWLKLVAPPILVFASLAGLMSAGGHGPGAMLLDDRPGGADGVLFVPLFRVTTDWQHYTMFSLAHLLDWANEHLLISPFGLPLLVLALAGYLKSRLPRPAQQSPARPGLPVPIPEAGTESGTVAARAGERSDDRRERSRGGQSESRVQPSVAPADARLRKDEATVTAFLVIASLAYLLLTFVWNPDYGGRQDWDLFAPSAFVYTSLAAYWLVRRFRQPCAPSGSACRLARIAPLLIAVSTLHTIAWVYFNTIP